MNKKPSLKNSVHALKHSILQSQSDSAVIQMYIAAVLRQPPLEQQFVPNLPKGQKRALQSCEHWSEDVKPSIIQTVANTVSFSNKWLAYEKLLLKYAHQLVDRNISVASRDEARTNLNQIFARLYSAISEKEQDAIDAADKISSFSSHTNQINDEFLRELNILKKKLSPESGIIEELDEKISSINESIKVNAGLIATSGLAIIGGGLMILVGSISDSMSAGTSTGVIVSGITFAAGGVGTLATASIKLDSEIKELADLESERKHDQQLFVSAGSIIRQVGCLYDKSLDASNSAKDLSTYCRDLKNDIKDFQQRLSNIEPGDSSLVLEIMHANSDWQSCLQAAERIQINTAGGTLPTITGSHGHYPKAA